MKIILLNIFNNEIIDPDENFPSYGTYMQERLFLRYGILHRKVCEVLAMYS